MRHDAFHITAAHAATADLGDLNFFVGRRRAEEGAGQDVRQNDEAGASASGGFYKTTACLMFHGLLWRSLKGFSWRGAREF
jgi:hypothetical protein